MKEEDATKKSYYDDLVSFKANVYYEIIAIIAYRMEVKRQK